MRIPATLAVLAALSSLPSAPSLGQVAYESWPVLTDPFASTGGGGIMIHDYDPVVAGGQCTTNFRAIEPKGTVYRNAIVFDAVEAQGGVLCTNGRWRSLDSDATGTTPFRVFLKNGVKRGSGE
ncbi:MAG: hypothetical protein Q8R85_19595 [Bosea sp. (in: a-proteobacteria)]|uniref:hypothetical protein n=1 Tax=Bosea sp. (in: a-proteobacteria) TaxID=1871050 RepID=UPI0027360FF0|nr:hypothetical protein [Bosea sp. (in: a-proteobacteria)]MDP3603372.1 hypothetical protein [Bosea sp. (in: a-proteobacteria)]WRH59290.1 MAG: hypothetical protein RSE11_05770 [Bosea sp. (in: a-proteobacteria)]